MMLGNPGAPEVQLIAQREQYAKQLQMLGRIGFPHRSDSLEWEKADESVTPYVSDGRWVADCPACNGGIATLPGYAEAACFDCGRVHNVVWPTDDVLSAATAALIERPVANRHWRPQDGETAQDLRLENIQYGYHPGGGR